MKLEPNGQFLTGTRESLSKPQLQGRQGRKRGRTLLIDIARKVRESDIGLVMMRKAFRTLQRFGITLSPNHYYWPIPDYKELESREWPAEAEPLGVDLALDRQGAFLREVVPSYQQEWICEDGPFGSVGYAYNNGYFETVDAEIAYCMVRRFKPRRIIEVGGGYSSRVLAAALDENLTQDGVRGDLVTIDPYPDRFPEKVPSDRIRVIPEPIQNVDLDTFMSLGPGDFLFLDSSHVVGVGSDVVREYLDILPRIDRGVLIHAHDIFIPSDYPREAVLKNLAFWSEQYLLQAFLMFNPCFEVVWASSAMQSHDPEGLERAFPRWKHSYRNMSRRKRRFLPTADGDRVWPSSFWMRKVG